MKKNWLMRLIFSVIVTLLGLGGWARQYNVSQGDYLMLAIIWLIVVYALSGLFIKAKKNNSKNLSSNKIYQPSSSPPSSKPTENKPLNPINQNTSAEEMPMNIKTSDEEIELSKKEKEKIWTNISITTSEEEKLYETIAIEVEKDRREGIWTKALVQADGDENKTKIQYIKLRVEIITNELKDKKFEEAISAFIKQKKRSLKIKKIINEEKWNRDKLQFDEAKSTGNYIAEHYAVENSDFKKNMALLEPNFIVTIYRLNERNGAGKRDKYYWITGKAKNKLRNFHVNVEGVKRNIEDYYNNLLNNLD